MSDIERIPSMRRPTRQGVPKRKGTEMAKPMAEGGTTKDAPFITGRISGAPEDPTPPIDPTMEVELELAAQPLLEGVSPPVPVFEPGPEPEPVAEPVAEEPQAEPETPAATEPDPVAATEPDPGSTWVASADSSEPLPPAEPPPPPAPPPVNLRGLLETVDAAFAVFRAAAYHFPAQNMTDRLGADGWTRKQMLEHVATWHDLAAERLAKMLLTGQVVPLDRDVDAVNATAARVAIGKSVGEVLQDIDASFGRLRRQILRLTEDQLHAGDDWAAHVISANTSDHYPDHLAELTPPEPPPGSGARR